MIWVNVLKIWLWLFNLEVISQSRFFIFRDQFHQFRFRQPLLYKNTPNPFKNQDQKPLSPLQKAQDQPP